MRSKSHPTNVDGHSARGEWQPLPNAFSSARVHRVVRRGGSCLAPTTKTNVVQSYNAGQRPANSDRPRITPTDANRRTPKRVTKRGQKNVRTEKWPSAFTFGIPCLFVPPSFCPFLVHGRRLRQQAAVTNRVDIGRTSRCQSEGECSAKQDETSPTRKEHERN